MCDLHVMGVCTGLDCCSQTTKPRWQPPSPGTVASWQYRSWARCVCECCWRPFTVALTHQMHLHVGASDFAGRTCPLKRASLRTRMCSLRQPPSPTASKACDRATLQHWSASYSGSRTLKLDQSVVVLRECLATATRPAYLLARRRRSQPYNVACVLLQQEPHVSRVAAVCSRRPSAPLGGQ